MNNKFKSIIKLALCLCVSSLFLLGCQSEEVGILDVVANGEDFVRDGFVSVDGWTIEFDELIVSLEEITVWKLESSFDASTGQPPVGENIVLNGNYLIDLANPKQNSSDGTILVSRLEEISIGHYNAISWAMVQSEGQGPLQMVGRAVKDDVSVEFDIVVEDQFAYSCGEYIGDERKGFVTADKSGDIEMTFHLDHVFGDFDSPADEALNRGALGFGPLADLAENGQLKADLSSLEKQLSAEDYDRLVDTLQTLGHVGEGHCYESSGGYTGEK